jgi:molecular chaperone DnaK
MQREAESHAAEDARRKELAEAKNNADTMAYTAEKTLRDNKDKVPEDLKTEVTGKITTVRQALNGDDAAAINNAAQDLSSAMQKLGSHVYSQQPPPSGAAQQPGGEQPEPPPQKSDEGTVEGEFREV